MTHQALPPFVLPFPVSSSTPRTQLTGDARDAHTDAHDSSVWSGPREAYETMVYPRFSRPDQKVHIEIFI